VLHRCGNGAQVGGDFGIFSRQFIELSDFDIGGNDTGPLGAGAQKPAALTLFARSARICSTGFTPKIGDI
jgi:hypothetical protein